VIDTKISDHISGSFETTGDWKAYIVLAIIFGVLNSVARPILNLVSFPLRWFTLGLFSLVINGLLLWLLEHSVRFLDFADITLDVQRWQMYVVVGLILAVFHAIVHWFEKKK
jgi:uncharacterized membrane protein YvlD (DUF360 family)